MYDVDCPETFEALGKWVHEVRSNPSKSNPVIIVLGNKRDSSDREPAVPTAQGRAYAESIDALFMEVSAKTGYNANEAISAVACAIQTRDPWSTEVAHVKAPAPKDRTNPTAQLRPYLFGLFAGALSVGALALYNAIKGTR